MADTRQNSSRRTSGDLARVAAAERQCTATSRQTGERCRRIVPVGHVVCHYHGGATQQAKDKARLRMLELIEPAVAQLARLMVNSNDERVQMRAIENILDRGGLPRGVKIDGQDARAMLVEKLQVYRAQAGIVSQDEDYEDGEQP